MFNMYDKVLKEIANGATWIDKYLPIKITMEWVGIDDEIELDMTFNKEEVPSSFHYCFRMSLGSNSEENKECLIAAVKLMRDKAAEIEFFAWMKELTVDNFLASILYELKPLFGV